MKQYSLEEIREKIEQARKHELDSQVAKVMMMFNQEIRQQKCFGGAKKNAEI